MIRLLTNADAEALAKMFEASDASGAAAHFHPFPLAAESAAMICQHTGSDRYFAAWDAEQVCGFGMLRGWDEGFEVPSFGVLVHPEKQGRGVGRALVRFALEEAWRVGAPRVRLTVHPENTRAMELYTREGFTQAGVLADGRVVMFAERK